jgi:hypothetical protein
LQIAVVGLLAHAMAGLLVKEARTAGLAAVAAAGLLGVAVECRPRRNRRKDRQP